MNITKAIVIEAGQTKFFEVGSDKVKKIEMSFWEGEGDATCVRVYFDDGSYTYFYRLDTIKFMPEARQ